MCQFVRVAVRGVAHDGLSASTIISYESSAWTKLLASLPGADAEEKLLHLAQQLRPQLTFIPMGVRYYHADPVPFTLFGLEFFSFDVIGYQSPMYWLASRQRPVTQDVRKSGLVRLAA